MSKFDDKILNKSIESILNSYGFRTIFEKKPATVITFKKRVKIYPYLVATDIQKGLSAKVLHMIDATVSPAKPARKVIKLKS